MKALVIKKLVKKYGDKTVLKKIDLTIEEGDFFALLGHNGAGKTTTIGIMTDLVEKTSGKVEIFGDNIDTSFAQAKKHIGVVPQEFNFNMFETVSEVPIIQAGYYGISRKIAKKRSEELLKALELWEHRNKEAKDLSGGMKRRLMIARALVHKPKFLILDEPTAGVDVELRKTMWSFIKNLNTTGTTILLTTHYLEEVEALCNKVAIISDGIIVKDTTTKKLLASLDEEIFVLDLKANKKPSKDLLKELKKFGACENNDGALEVTISRKYRLNELFEILNANNTIISSMRNKVNRIEQLFMNLTK